MRYTAAGLYESLTRFPLLSPDHDESTVGANIDNLILILITTHPLPSPPMRQVVSAKALWYQKNR